MDFHSVGIYCFSCLASIPTSSGTDTIIYIHLKKNYPFPIVSLNNLGGADSIWGSRVGSDPVLSSSVPNDLMN